MSLSSLQTDAFVAVAQWKSFSEAARRLHLTQSALSQRVLNLEDELGSTLFVREASGIRLTDLGERLLRYCLAKDSLEAEFLSSFFTQDRKQLSGVVKIAGFSTVVRSILIPSLKDILHDNPGVQVELFTREMRDLPMMLEIGEAGLVLLNQPIDKQGVENVLLGHEKNVLIQPLKGSVRENVFLDHDPDDTITERFLKAQKRPLKKWTRSYFDEIYAIIDGVEAGAGCAVVPAHLLNAIHGVEMVPGYKPLKTDVYLSYYRQAYYTALQSQVIQAIKKQSSKLLDY